MTNELSMSSPPKVSPGLPLSLVGIGLDPGTLGRLKLFAESSPMIQIQSELDQYPAEDREAISRWIGSAPSDIYLIDFDRDPEAAASFTESLRASAPHSGIFAVSSQSQPELIIQAMHSGCTEYLVKPLEREQLLNSIARAGGRKREKKQERTAEIMVLIGAKGGCGVTTLSTQLGVLFAGTFSKKTLLLDCHSCFGDAALYLGLTKYRYNSFDLMENTDRLDSGLLQSLELHHVSGLDLVPAPDEVLPARQWSSEAVSQTFDFLRSAYDYIILDLPPGLNAQNLDFIRNADRIYVVTVAEVSALRNAARYIDYFRRKDLPQEKIRVVLNRHQAHDLITDEQIERVIRMPIFWKVPNQYALMVQTISGGDFITQSARSEARRNLKGWAEAMGAKTNTKDDKNDSNEALGHPRALEWLSEHMSHLGIR